MTVVGKRGLSELAELYTSHVCNMLPVRVSVLQQLCNDYLGTFIIIMHPLAKQCSYSRARY